MNKTINGKKTSQEVEVDIKKKVDFLASKGKIPKLVVVIIGNDSASEVYVKSKNKKAESLGISSQIISLPANVSESELLKTISDLNSDDTVDGILVQLPLPKHINADKIINAISVEKDVDGFNPYNLGKLVIGQPAIIPCTPNACLYLLKQELGNDFRGKNAVIVGRSNIVGKPMFNLLLNHNATVNITHSGTKNLEEHTSKADILIVAVGIPNLITRDYIKQGAIVIDVGINRIFSEEKGKNILTGDVDFDDVYDKVSKITPVPGGVGPMTITFLMNNTVEIALTRSNLVYK